MRLGRGAATTYPGNLVHSDCILIEGSNMAECHPVAFRWVMQAKLKGAKIIHADPRFTRTTARPVVVLPDPDSPTSPSVSPARMENDTSSTA